MTADKPRLRPQKMPPPAGVRLAPALGPQPSLQGRRRPCLPGPPGLIPAPDRVCLCGLPCLLGGRPREGRQRARLFSQRGASLRSGSAGGRPRPQPEHRALPCKAVPFGQPWREAEIYLQGNKKVCISNGLRPITLTPSSARLPGLRERQMVNR